ncbi:MAG TPA: energy transducer TonB [Candidatus Sulfotelmatobacter sp.]|nr:energy transducer TonB [Candidatus Sulfotelmatobacter sp.]
MSAVTQSGYWQKPARRQLARYTLQEPLDLTVLRSGVPETLPGRCLNVCQHGIAAIIAGEVSVGDLVGIELQFPERPESLRARAVVRYHDKLRCGMEFVGATESQAAVIRRWVERAKPVVENEKDEVAVRVEVAEPKPPQPVNDSGGSRRRPTGTLRPRRWMLLVLAFVALGGFWWHWSRGWHDLENGLSLHAEAGERPRLQVPAKVMQKLVVHQVEPDYPDAARAGNLQGIIVLDLVVGRDGSVLRVTPLNGPEVLARAASDALQWWKFRPYRVDGTPVVVETTVAMEFKP